MTRPEAALLVRERWERLGIGTPEEFPHVFSSDVDNMLAESDVNEAINQALEVADQGKANPRIGSLCVGNEGVSGCPELGDRIGSRPRGATGTEKPPHQVQILSADSQTFLSSLDHFTDKITRYVDKKLGRETELAEVGQ